MALSDEERAQLADLMARDETPPAPLEAPEGEPVVVVVEPPSAEEIRAAGEADAERIGAEADADVARIEAHADAEVTVREALAEVTENEPSDSPSGVTGPIEEGGGDEAPTGGHWFTRPIFGGRK